MIETYVFAGLVALLAIGNVVLRIIGGKDRHLVFNLAVLLVLLPAIYMLGSSPGTHFSMISVNPFSVFFFMLFTATMFLLNLIAYARSKDYNDFALLGAFALTGMYLVVSSVSLITIFLGLELMSIPSAFIVLLSRRQSLEAATKLFIMASVAIAFLSFAVVLVYGSSNSLALQSQQASGLIYFALALFIASLGFEASIFPFNVLLPDVYQGSAGYATAMLGGLNKKVGLAALMQVLILVFISFHLAFTIVAVLAVLTMFYGNLVALVQTNLKRLFAYSSISQAGYILIGIAVATQSGVGASIFQMFAHAFLFIGALGIVAWLESKDRNEINDVIGLYKENRFAAIALTIFMLSFVGLPFTTGFMGKFLIFLSAVNGGLVWLALFGVINSIISIFYYAKVMTAMYTTKFGSYHIKMDRYTFTVIAACLAITLAFGIYPQPMIQAVTGAAGHLIGAGV
ncbi:MAG: NADH-quinone oxidoreductase subunit N [Candidatus Micrarchaeota archaeon]|nr:NADH-quinone oxidoreductase subunit N [Candidatus Micrarchaeota archaeon]